MNRGAKGLVQGPSSPPRSQKQSREVSEDSQASRSSRLPGEVGAGSTGLESCHSGKRAGQRPCPDWSRPEHVSIDPGTWPSRAANGVRCASVSRVQKARHGRSLFSVHSRPFRPQPTRPSTSPRGIPRAVLPAKPEPVGLTSFPLSMRTNIHRLQQAQRNQHIQICVRREIASKRDYLRSDFHYYYHCCSWIVGSGDGEVLCLLSTSHYSMLPQMFSRRYGFSVKELVSQTVTSGRTQNLPFHLDLAIVRPSTQVRRSFSRNLFVLPRRTVYLPTSQLGTRISLSSSSTS